MLFSYNYYSISGIKNSNFKYKLEFFYFFRIYFFIVEDNIKILCKVTVERGEVYNL